jgi:hypothetical protein
VAVQAYLGFPRAAGETPEQLKGFAKVMLQPGEQRRVQLRLNRKAFENWPRSSAAGLSRRAAIAWTSGRRRATSPSQRHLSLLAADAEPTRFKQRYQAMPCNLMPEHVTSSTRLPCEARAPRIGQHAACDRGAAFAGKRTLQ